MSYRQALRISYLTDLALTVRKEAERALSETEAECLRVAARHIEAAVSELRQRV